MFLHLSAEQSFLTPHTTRSRNGAVAIETSERCLYDTNRSRVCNRSGSLARDLQNRGNTALATGWYVSHVQLIELTMKDLSVKVGYPPKSLTLIPELPISSLGLSKGEQLIVNQNGGGPSTKSTPTRSTTSTSSPAVVPQPSTRPSAPAQPTTNKPDSVETEGGFLVHRVRSLVTSRRRDTDQNGQIVPDDNSCLFSSVAIVFEQNIGKAQEIRKSVLIR